MDHYADDLAALIEALDLRDVILMAVLGSGGATRDPRTVIATATHALPQ